MKQYKKIVPVIGLMFMLSCANISYATEIDASQITNEVSTSNDSTESLEESFGVNNNPDDIFSNYTEIGMVDENGNTLVFIDSDRHIFYDEKYDLYYDENGTVSREEVAKLGIIADEGTIVETLPEAKAVQLNISVDFDNFEVNESTLYDIYVMVTGEPRYVNEEELTEEYANILLSRSNNFTASTTIDVTDKIFIMTAYVGNDEVNAYRLSIDEEEYGYKEFDSTMDMYDVELHVTLPEESITDTNLAPSLSDTDKKYIDGSYGESRRAEIKESLEQESNPEQPVKPEEKETNMAGIIILISIITIISVAGIGIYLWRKKLIASFLVPIFKAFKNQIIFTIHFTHFFCFFAWINIRMVFYHHFLILLIQLFFCKFIIFKSIKFKGSFYFFIFNSLNYIIIVI